MRFIFADAENIGLKEVEAIDSTIADKVLVFSRVDSCKEICERKLFLYMSSYPEGSDQADFYIIGNLVGIISSLTEEQKKLCQFMLYSKDNSLVNVFIFQCRLHKLDFRVCTKRMFSQFSEKRKQLYANSFFKFGFISRFCLKAFVYAAFALPETD